MTGINQPPVEPKVDHYAIGVLFFEGKVVIRDTKTAIEHFEKAAKEDHVPAILKLADVYEASAAKNGVSEKANVLRKLAALLSSNTPLNSGAQETCYQLKREAGLAR